MNNENILDENSSDIYKNKTARIIVLAAVLMILGGFVFYFLMSKESLEPLRLPIDEESTISISSDSL